MSYWNYRIIKKKIPEHNENSYQIHEVHYEDDGSICGWTKNPISPYGTSQGELREDIRYQLSAFRKPILTEANEDGSLVSDEEESEINSGHYFEALDRASVALDYLYEFVGSHPVVRKHEGAKKLYDKAEEALAELYQLLGGMEFDNKSS